MISLLPSTLWELSKYVVVFPLKNCIQVYFHVKRLDILMALDVIIMPITTPTHFKTPRDPIRCLEHMEIG